MKNLLKELNQRPIAYYPIYRKITGSTTAGILLSQLMYWLSKSDKIHKTDAQIMEETLLTKKELEGAKRAIKKLAFIEVTREGVPAKTYYEIDWEKLEKALIEMGKNGETSSPKTGKPDSPKGGNCTPQKGETLNDISFDRDYTETTTERDNAREVPASTASTAQSEGKPSNPEQILKIFPDVEAEIAEKYINSRQSSGWRRGRTFIVDWVPDFRNFLSAFRANQKPEENEGGLILC